MPDEITEGVIDGKCAICGNVWPCTGRGHEAATPSPDSLDVERLARAIQSTVLTSIDEYKGPGMGAYAERWDALTDKQKRHVLGDARALAARYDRLALQARETPAIGEGEG